MSDTQAHRSLTARDDGVLTRKVDNPYLRYIRKVRSGTAHAGDKQTLGKKSGELTNKIIQEFLDWYNSLGGGHWETNIDHATVQELFKIGFDLPAAQSVCVSIFEMPVIPKSLAEVFMEPKMTVDAALHRLHKEDKAAARRAERKGAVEKMPPSKEPHSKRYLHHLSQSFQAVGPKDLETMSTVWDGIENLWSTIGFANWLKSHAEVPRPAYFQETMLNEIPGLDQLVETHEYFSSSKADKTLQDGTLLISMKKKPRRTIADMSRRGRRRQLHNQPSCYD